MSLFSRILDRRKVTRIVTSHTHGGTRVQTYETGTPRDGVVQHIILDTPRESAAQRKRAPASTDH